MRWWSYMYIKLSIKFNLYTWSQISFPFALLVVPGLIQLGSEFLTYTQKLNEIIFMGN